MKIDRQKVYNKCGGRCGYCGSIIAIKDMQVDHMHPKCNGGADSPENLMPSCRKCNHYKRSYTVEGFRKSMLTLHERVAKIYIHEVAANFGMATLQPWNGLFFFEKFNQQEETGK